MTYGSSAYQTTNGSICLGIKLEEFNLILMQRILVVYQVWVWFWMQTIFSIYLAVVELSSSTMCGDLILLAAFGRTINTVLDSSVPYPGGLFSFSMVADANYFYVLGGYGKDSGGSIVYLNGLWSYPLSGRLETLETSNIISNVVSSQDELSSINVASSFEESDSSMSDNQLSSAEDSITKLCMTNF